MVHWVVIYGNYLWLTRGCAFARHPKTLPKGGKKPLFWQQKATPGYELSMAQAHDVSEHPQIVSSQTFGVEGAQLLPEQARWRGFDRLNLPAVPANAPDY